MNIVAERVTAVREACEQTGRERSRTCLRFLDLGDHDHLRLVASEVGNRR